MTHLPLIRRAHDSLPALAGCVTAGLVLACGQGTGSELDDATATTTTGVGGSVVGVGVGGVGVGGNGGHAGNLILTTTGAGGTSSCEREVSFTAVTLGKPAPFDLVIVADHSDSLGFSRDELAAGLSDLLDGVRGRQVRVHLLTPTQYGATSAPALFPLTGDAVVAWQDPATGDAYEPATTSYSQTCTGPMDAPITCPDPQGDVPYKVMGDWVFEMPQPIAELTPTQTDAEFQAQEQALADAILSIGGSGSPNEQPLCTLARYVSQPPALLPENAVFLLISDEDDISTPDDCLIRFEGELRLTEHNQAVEACASDCDIYRYELPREYHWQRLEYHCAAMDDLGNVFPETENFSWLNEARQDTCDGFALGPCDAEETERVRPFCDPGTDVISCERQCETRTSNCRVDLPDTSVDACSEAFVYNDTEYADLFEFCSDNGETITGECTGERGLNRVTAESRSGYHDPIRLMEGTSTSDVANYFLTQAQAVIGRDRFLVEAIVLDPSFSCELGVGQSYAENLSQIVADPSHLFPLCESYAPALASVLDFAQALIQTEFSVALEDGESVSNVSLLASNGSERSLPANQWSHDAETGVLSVDRNAITSGDQSLRVEVTSDCLPVIK